MFKKKLLFPLSLVLAFTMISVLSFSSVITAYAYDSKEELKQELESVENQKSDAEAKAEASKAKEEKIKGQIVEIEGEIKDTESTLLSIENKIAKTKKKIEKVKKEIKQKEKELAKQKDDLGERLRIMYESGDASMVEVLVGSSSFVDFMSNLDMVQLIHEYDMKVVDDINNKIEEINQKRKELNALNKELKAEKEEQEDKRATLAVDKKQLAKSKEQAHKETLEAWAEVEALEAESASIAASIKALQQQSSMSTQKYSGGAMGWPANGSITSEFGYRTHPVYGQTKLHTGLDIGVSHNAPIFAASDGEVIMAGWNGGYGNCVVIDHGSGISTLYAHNTSVAVSVGQKVKRGDQVAYAGTTGTSTGTHCHFEVRVNGTPQNPLGWL